MDKTASLRQAIKRLLKSRGLAYRDLAKALSLSEPTVKRMLSLGTMSVARLADICEALDVSFLELAKLADDSEQEPADRLTTEQEQQLAADPKLASYFYLLVHRWDPDLIERDYEFSRQEAERYLLKLDRLGLIALAANRKVKLLVARSINWSPNGPLAEAFAKDATAEFLRGPFDQAGLFAFRAGELSAPSLRHLNLAQEKLVKDFERLARADASLAKEETTAVGMVVASRSFVFTLFQKYKKNS